MPATRHVPTVTDITAITRQYGYTGSADFTIADMVRWLPGAASGWQGDGAWDFFCQGLEGAPESACGTNPFNGDTGIYGNPIAQYLSLFWHHPLQTTLATLRLAWAIAQPEIIAAGAPDLGAPDLAVAAEDAGDGAGAEVLFGQRRVSPEFSSEGTFKGRSIYAVAQDLQNGTLDPNGIKISAFWHEGQLVSENTRSLATLSLAGLRPTNIDIMDSVPDDVLARLTEDPLVGGPLPSRVTAVTPSIRDLRIGDIISIPEG